MNADFSPYKSKATSSCQNNQRIKPIWRKKQLYWCLLPIDAVNGIG